MPNRIYELRNLYFQQSRYSVDQAEKKYEYPALVKWPANSYFEKLKPDTDLLHHTLSSHDEYKTGKLSEQVFGSELKNNKISLQHSANLLHERAEMHKQHLQDIDDRHLKVQERLFGVEINNFPDRNKQLRTLEGQLLQLEQQRREEELAFWKDTVELRQTLFETANDYRATRHRYSIFSDLEGEHV